MKVDKISELTTNRLSVYLRCLNELASSGVKTTSSDDLAKRFHLNSAQIRKDLAYFGEFGVRGVGYYVETLQEHLNKILGLDKQHRVCIIGSGRMGTALTDLANKIRDHGATHPEMPRENGRNAFGKQLG